MARWYCPCCGTRLENHTARRLLVIVPPNSKHSVKKQIKAAESDEEYQASIQASTAASSANINATKGNNDIK
eukprot:7191236-Prorocentrum_lima.AAC.1